MGCINKLKIGCIPFALLEQGLLSNKYLKGTPDGLI